MKKSERNKLKRSERYTALIESMSKRVETETVNIDTKSHFIVGKVDGKILYTTKSLKGHEHGARLKKSWLRRISKKLAGGRNYD